MRACSPEECAWPEERLDECLAALLKKAGLASNTGDLQHSSPADENDVEAWIENTAKHLGCESEPVEASYADLEKELACAFPSILQISHGCYLAVVRGTEQTLHVLTPKLQVRTIANDTVCRRIREPEGRHKRAEIERALAETGIETHRAARTADVLLREQLGRKRFRRCWIFRSSPGAPFLAWLRQAGVTSSAAGLLSTHSVEYLIWIVSWALLGSLSFQGHMDRGWLIGWSLLLATLIPCRVLGTWLQGKISIGVGGLLKRRLLAGALRLSPEEIRTQGTGSFLAQALEAEAVETLALGGGVASLLATVDIFISGFILGRVAILLLLWFILAAAVALRFLRHFYKWTGTRMHITNDLVESMVGHRTRLAQQHPEHWHDSEDQALDEYLGISQNLDRTGTVLITAIPRGWLIAGLATLAPSIVASHASPSQTAVLLGGILLAYSAFDRLVTSFSEIAAAMVSWKTIAPLYKAAERPERLGNVIARPASNVPGAKILEADRLTYRYRKQGGPALQACSLVVRQGDRILLEGPSGGGKTTFASLISGRRTPESGLLLANGLDIETLGTASWREQVVAAPQFHENHILTETLAFNLLFGKCWPPSAADMEEAEAVCRSLGLGELLDRMPSGLLQMVGEGGWQLSHGERSRVYIARALLQNPELIILDESFGALDPETLQVALEFTLERANTLMVIAHP
jgi:ATP-binding cassette, subfamily B, bacterial